MNKGILITLALLISIYSFGQEKKKFKLKKPELRIGEKLGHVAGNMMTGKTEDLSVTAPIVSIISGIYSPETKTSEAKYFPKGTKEGDHLMAITFMKNEGMGMLQVKGDVKCEGDEMEYVSLGSYMYVFDEPIKGDKTITIETETGDKASYTLSPVPEIEILSINGDPTFPIVDLSEDMTIEVSHPEGAEGTKIKVGLLAMAAGAKAVNYFAEFKATGKEIKIPKESFSNLEISGALNTGQVDKGLTYLVVMREKVLEEGDIKAEHKLGNASGMTFKSAAYGTKEVLVKGKQEDGVITQVRFAGKYKDKLAYSVYKPNARTGIPFSRGSKFGLVSLSISGRTYKKETESGKDYHSGFGASYTTTWTKTTTYQFPQLPESYWENVMDAFYKKFQASMKTSFSIGFEDVDKVTASPNYKAFFAGNEYNNEKGVSKSYRNTLFTTPTTFGEIWKNRSSSQSAETPSTMIMKELGLDGIVSLQISFDIGANKEDEVVLLPQVNFSIKGADETNDYKEGTYAEGFITYKEGVPYSESKVKSDPNYLVEVLNVDRIVENIDFMLKTLQAKEQELGFEKIWAIGE